MNQAEDAPRETGAVIPTGKVTLWRLITDANKAHRAFRYAVAVAGIIAYIALFAQFGVSFATLVLGAIVFGALMIAFLMFTVLVELAKKPTGQAKYAALAMMWTEVILILITSVAIVTSTFWNRPLPVRDWLVKSLGLPALVAPPAPVKVEQPERFKGTYIGIVKSNVGGRQVTSTATVRLDVSANVVAGSYDNDGGDSGTIAGTLQGDNLSLQFASTQAPGKCQMNASLSSDRKTLKGVYVCDAADPNLVEGAQVELKRQDTSN